jgi:UDP-N-acetyl-D-galactosamine dehydrogenase
VLGLTFKENCPDIRNTKVVDILAELKEYGMQPDVFDPWVDSEQAQHEYGIELVTTPELGSYDAVVVAVAHHQFKTLGQEGIRAFGKPAHIIYDLKYLLPKSDSDLRL